MDDDVPDFLNIFFANIAARTRLFDDTNVPEYDVNITHENPFVFLPPSIHEIRELTKQIDTNMSSCIDGINAKTCKNLLEIIPEFFFKLFANSLFLGIFPKKWACAKLTFLPKEGSSANPGNWRPISQTNIFADY